MQPCVLASLFVMATGSHYFVAGATGATGQRLVNQLLNDPSVTRVTAAVRDKAAAPFAASDRLKLVEVDYEAQTPSLKGVDVCITAIGTSRANAVVKESMEKMGNDEGFAHWLQKVDLGINVALAKQAHADGVQHFARISAINADSSKRGRIPIQAAVGGGAAYQPRTWPERGPPCLENHRSRQEGASGRRIHGAYHHAQGYSGSRRVVMRVMSPAFSSRMGAQIGLL
eukprot:GEMP01064282.1.p1 GENE.GEMP01064282.1~~GEMP01064282.1.p1  ORF type:complete len:228 (+),score=46.98 GEMP01064282.1:24-707(+)